MCVGVRIGGGEEFQCWGGRRAAIERRPHAAVDRASGASQPVIGGEVCYIPGRGRVGMKYPELFRSSDFLPIDGLPRAIACRAICLPPVPPPLTRRLSG